LSQASAVAPGTATCGPFGESATYLTAAGQQINGTRTALGAASPMTTLRALSAIPATIHFRRVSGIPVTDSCFCLVTRIANHSTSIEPGRSDQSVNHNLTRALSAFDLKHSMVASYEYRLPLDRFFSRGKNLLRGWTVSGITRVSSGFPVTISSDGDRSLIGSLRTA